MPGRRKNNQEKQPQGPQHEIIQRPMDEVMHLSMLPYAEHVILERALPRAEDGLKPVQRRILFTMNELGITPDKPHKKCARIVGDCLGKYHPHGDSSVYDALVRLAQPYSMRTVLVDGHGNFGSIDGDSAAAMRYTEARMAPLALEMLRDIDKDTVPFSFNFDDTLKEPDLLPARYPNLLVNGTSGIAVGLATNIPPHNLGEAIDAALLVLENPETGLDEMLAVLPGPDFPTGGSLLQSEEIRAAYETGKGKLQLRASVHFEDGNSGRKLLVITEVPYQVSKSQMLEHIQRLREEKKNLFGGIYDIRDESDRTGLRAVIELRKEADPDSMLALLYKHSDMQITFGVNMVAIAGGRPRQMGLLDLLRCYVSHQKEVVTRRTRYELEQAKAREHVLAGLMVAVNHLDEVIAIIRNSKTPRIAKEQLENHFGLSDIQAQAILDLRLQRLTGLELEALRKEYQEILKTIDRLSGILSNERKLIAVIRKEMLEIRERYADPRRTKIVEDELKDSLPVRVREISEDTMVLLTKEKQLRRMNPKLAAKLMQQEHIWEEIFSSLLVKEDQSVHIFTSTGLCRVVECGKIPESQKLKDRGALLSGLVHGVGESEQIVSVLNVMDMNQTDLLFVTRKGQLKRTDAAEYLIRRFNFAAINLKGDDEVVDVLPIARDDSRDLILLSQAGNALRFPLSEISQTGRTTAGVRGMTLGDGDEIRYALVPSSPKDTILAVNERGYGKRIPVSDLQVQARSRNGVGLLSQSRKRSEEARLVGCLLLSESVQMIVIRQKYGTVTRFAPDEIPAGRRTSPNALLVSVLMDDVVMEVTVSDKQKV